MNTYQKHAAYTIENTAQAMHVLDPSVPLEECRRIAKEFVLAKWGLKVTQAELALCRVDGADEPL